MPRTSMIWVVDDDPDLRQMVGTYLLDQGYDVRSLSDVKQLEARLEFQRPDLIVLDLMMPEMDGFGFLRALRARPDGDVPVVVLTAKEVTAAEKESLNRQADRVIAKGSMSLAEIGRQLRVLYARSATEPVPGQLQGLLDRLAEKDAGEPR